ncbi:hypothetical protein [uncultured Mycobacterium sp.]|uniref:hypothetical protein n=1 Tax=uncultured Mycobacterium sp. TaxID=171292 RepID=UPI0035CA6260
MITSATTSSFGGTELSAGSKQDMPQARPGINWSAMTWRRISLVASPTAIKFAAEYGSVPRPSAGKLDGRLAMPMTPAELVMPLCVRKPARPCGALVPDADEPVRRNPAIVEIQPVRHHLDTAESSSTSVFFDD